MDSTTGRNILNCSPRYRISLNDIVILHILPRENYSYYRASQLDITISVGWTHAM